MRTRAKKIAWTPEQLAWIETNKLMVRREAHAEFCRLFQSAVSFDAYRSLCKRNGWKAGRAWLKPGYVSPILDRNWSAEELAWVEAHRTMERPAAVALFNAKFGKNVQLAAYGSLCKRKGWPTGRDGRIKPGNIPMNKGKKMPFNANSARTQFKKGNVSPHKVRPIGHEWLHPNGYVYIIIPETNPHTGFKQRSVIKHTYLWEQKHGPVPDGMCLKCKDGNRANCDPSNWELIPRGVLPLLLGLHDGIEYDAAPEQLKPVIMTRAKLRHKAKHKKEKI